MTKTTPAVALLSEIGDAINRTIDRRNLTPTEMFEVLADVVAQTIVHCAEPGQEKIATQTFAKMLAEHVLLHEKMVKMDSTATHEAGHA